MFFDTNKILKVFTTFSGIGSAEMALKNIGISHEIVGISEVDKYAILAYDAIHNKQNNITTPNKETMLSELKEVNIGYNFTTGKSEMPTNISELEKLYVAHKRSNNFGDITLIDEKSLPDFDMFTYSFPCRDISVAGKMMGFDRNSNTKSSLLWECERIIKEKKPKYLIMENVKNIIGKTNINNFFKWISILNSLGYNSYWKVLNSSNFGVPQNRERVIMISILKSANQTYSFPLNKKLNTYMCDLLENEVGDKYFIKESKYKHLKNNLPHQKISYCIDASYYKGTSLNGFLNKKRRQLVQIGKLIQKGFESNKRIYSSDGLCPTLITGNSGNSLPKIKVEEDNDFRIRRLTPKECWRLMGYKDEDFQKAKDVGLSDTKLYERAGRGIVVPMLEEVFKSLFYKEENPAHNEYIDFFEQKDN